MTVGRWGSRALKAALWAFAALANPVGAHGQGTIGHFTNITAYLYGSCEVPSNDSAYTGSASFSYNLFGYNPLSNTVVDCHVYLSLPFSPTSAGVYGPAAPNRTAPLLFDLGQSCIVTTIVTII